MEKKKEIIIIIGIITTIILTLTLILCFSKTKEYKANVSINTDNIISYTIDGERANEKPNKEEGYKANKITCTNNSNLVWDNDLWEVEVIESKVKDRCIVDFTKEESTQGYKVKVTSSIEGSLDSYNKATTYNGNIKIYPKVGYRITGYSGCTGEIRNNTLIIKNITENTTCNITTNTNTLADVIKDAYPSKGERTDFSNIYTASELHETQDDQGTTYYFTGNPNNWVSFAGKLWRIIRINGDGSVRLLYAGTGGEDGYLTDVGTTAYNTSYNHPAYVGWKYTIGGTLDTDRGNITKSPIYSKVENWYNTLSETDKSYINSDAVYCNDRNIGSGSYSTSSTFYYAAYSRLTSKGAPSLSCNASDQFKDGFGLMTADEVVLAGGLYGTNNASAYYYLNASGGSSTGSYWWWTMSPYNWYGNAAVFFVNGSDYPGRLNGWHVHGAGVVRPVVSLKSNVLVTSGDGSGNNPYEVSLPTLSETIKIDASKKGYASGERTNFTEVYSENGLHRTTDTQGITYYYTGNPDNWVSFAGKMWRIIRINGDGSIRLLYAGTGGTDGYLTDVGQIAYNPSSNHPAYVGWKYTLGGTLDKDRENGIMSPIYTKVESWYNSLSTADKAYINTGAVYCNDRSITEGLYSISSEFYYAGYQRFVNSKSAPTLSCDVKDQFKDGFGLMTADEVVLAGGLFQLNNASTYYYLNVSEGSQTGSYWWWTMSPWRSGNSSTTAGVFAVLGSDYPGSLSWPNVDDTNGVIRPVISLKSNVLVTSGDGSGNNPYAVALSS